MRRSQSGRWLSALPTILAAQGNPNVLRPRRSRTNGAQHTSPGQARVAGAALGAKPKAAGAPPGREESFTPVVARDGGGRWRSLARARHAPVHATSIPDVALIILDLVSRQKRAELIKRVSDQAPSESAKISGSPTDEGTEPVDNQRQQANAGAQQRCRECSCFGFRVFRGFYSRTASNR